METHNDNHPPADSPNGDDIGESIVSMTEYDSLGNPVWAWRRCGLPPVPHLEQYSGLWAMREEDIEGMFRQAMATDWRVHVEASKAQNTDATQAPTQTIRMIGDVALVEMVGRLTKYGSSLSTLQYGTVGVRRALRQAATDDSVRGIVLMIDSPGGSTMGVDDLAADIARIDAIKPVVAYVEDMGASGAYWIASQARRIVVNNSAVVGAIGVYGVVYDWSAMFAREGVKAYVIRSGQFKGIGTKGEELTDVQRAELQRDVDAFHALFTAAVASGRNMTPEAVAQLATGRVWFGADSVGVGLADEVGTLEGALAIAAGGGPGRRDRRNRTMSEQNSVTNPATPAKPASEAPVVPRAATFAELKAGLPGADSDFICEQLGSEATLAQAQSAWMAEQAKRLEASEKRAAEAEKTAASRAQSAGGVSAVETGDTPQTETDGDLTGRWNALVAKHEKTGKTRAQAVRSANRENPELRRAMVAAYNSKHRRPIPA